VRLCGLHARTHLSSHSRLKDCITAASPCRW
jgi:hypothetical protein